MQMLRPGCPINYQQPVWKGVCTKMPWPHRSAARGAVAGRGRDEFLSIVRALSRGGGAVKVLGKLIDVRTSEMKIVENG
jgi:hypothetical protein